MSDNTGFVGEIFAVKSNRYVKANIDNKWYIVAERLT